MAHFSKASLNIPNLHSTVAIHALLVRLCLGKFLDILYANLSIDMDELHHRADQYINIE